VSMVLLLLALPFSLADGVPGRFDMVVCLVKKELVCVCVGRRRREVGFLSEG
jgi:hypothetical protein